jgi:dihydrofolate synthase/folylpolyglutamate synthase
MTITNFSQAREVLNHYVPRDWSMSQPYGLERMRSLMDYLDNPQNKLKVIHVAGTSGKTSTAYYSAALLHSTGAKVGLTVSPHVSEINERLQINLKPMAEDQYCKELSEFIEIIKKSDIEPTYFELLVAFAYWEFAKQKVDYAVIEVGLGGLLDGTNVVERADKICIITDIGLDHVKILGNTLSAIATQKAGIITNHNVVFTYRQDPGVVESITNAAMKHKAKLELLDSALTVPGTEFLPKFQVRNFGLAHRATDYVIKRDLLAYLSDERVIKAAHTHIPARMEIFHKNNKVVIIDGAHNAQKLTALGEAIRSQFPNQPVAALISFVAGGEERLETAMKAIAPLSQNLIITTFAGEQDTPKHSVDPAEIAAAGQGLDLKITVIEKPELALGALLAQPEPILVVTGSFFLLNHIRPLMLSS